jgi:hypothetical protein
MKLSTWDQQEMASLPKSAAIQRGETTTSSKRRQGWMEAQRSRLPGGRGEEFFLDILFRKMSDGDFLSIDKCLPMAGRAM